VPALGNRRIKALAVFAALCAAAMPAQSQQAGAEPTLDSVVVTGHYNNGIGTSDAASQGTVNSKLIVDQPLLRPGEVLEFIPGMVVTQHSGDGKANQYFLRGYNLDHGTDFATRIDGVPVNMPSNAHGQGYSDVNYLIPELVQHIDYRKGPYFAQDGDFSSAGSADVQYRSSLDRGIADLTAGGFGYRRALFAGSTPLGRLGSSANAGGSPAPDGGSPVLLGAVELLGNDGPWTTPEGLRKINGLLRLSDGTRAQGWSIDGIYYNARWNSTDQVPLSLIDSGQLGRFSAVDPSDGGNSERLILSGEWRQSDSAGYSRLSAYAQRYRLQLWSNFTFFEFRPATGDQFEQSEQRDVFGGQAVKGWTHSLYGRDSVTEAGFQLRYDHVRAGLFNTQARSIFQTVSDNRIGQSEAGVYVQNTTSWARWLRSVAGLRGDRINMNVNALTIPQNSGSATASKLSPKLSLIFGPWARTEFFINTGRGFHSNDARGVTEKVDASTGLPPPSAVPALVGSLGKEIGVRTEVIPGLQSSLALWSLYSDGELVFSADSSIGNTSANGASRRYGVEWNNHWTPNRWLNFDADLAWIHARYATPNDNGEAGDLIPNAVSKVGRFGVSVQNLGPWSGGISTRYIGPYPLTQDGSLRAPSAIVTNLRVQRQFTPGAAVALDVLNLFNRQYYDIAYGQDFQLSPTSPAVPSGVTVHPGEPRQVRVALKLQF
jgi:outer membrane receptor protein involved in Fe transport